ncbi:MAG: LptF/LptG family permease [Alphaproteobacteria bacterium]
MTLYVRLFMKRLVWVFLGVFLAFLALAWMGRIVQYMDILQQAAIPLSAFFSWVALLLPYVVYMILPMVAVVTTFLVYHYGHQHHILTVLASVGLSVGRRMRPAWYFGGICGGMALIISCVVLPASYHGFKVKQNAFREQQAMNVIQPQQFFTLDKKTFYIQHVAQDGGLQDILIWTHEEGGQSFLYAKAGRLVQGDEGSFLVLKQGYQHLVDDRDRLSRLDFDHYQLRLDPQAAEVYQRRNLLEFSPIDLVTADRFSTPQQAKRWVGGHVRLLYPLLAVLFAVYPALVFSTLSFSRTSGVMRPFLRVVPPVLGYFGLFLLLSQSAEAFPPLVYALYGMVVLAFVGLAFPRFRLSAGVRGVRP